MSTTPTDPAPTDGPENLKHVHAARRHHAHEAPPSPHVLLQAPLFTGLDHEAATTLAAAMPDITLNKRAILFCEGDASDNLYVVTVGKIKLSKSDRGRESLLSVLGPGQMFGELSLFDPGPRMSTATALTRCTLRALNQDNLMRWLSDQPEVASALLGQLARRLRHTSDVVADLVFCDVPGRVAKALLDLAAQFGETANDGIHVHHDLTQQELAHLVGSSRETVNKALADFAARGWIRLQPRSVTLLEPTQIQHRAH